MELKDYAIIEGEEIDLFLDRRSLGDPQRGRSPEYKFKIRLHGSVNDIGHINMRLGDDEKVIQYIGHIGYGIDEAFRSNKYAAKACTLLKQVARSHGMDRVIITCNPDNFASRRICEVIGAELLEIVDIPVTASAYSEEEPQKCRFLWRVK
ncbi:MAG: GNAT family N-acetyltransferase [Clostridia bacterium]|nr:GNAT family N-acetyltransferase [Clostridia bacterium]